ncbi:hypothetical protein [Geodermatophilus sp. SYSU D00815]
MTHHTLDLVPLRRAATGGWREATCWLDEGVERVVLGCLCGWRGRDLTAVDLGGVAPGAFAGDIADEAAFTRVSHEMEAAHAAEIVPALRDLPASREVEATLREGVS